MGLKDLMSVELKDWLGLVKEDALEPDLPICDAHHHLWDRPTSRYLIEDLVEDAKDHNVVSTVFVECSAGYREDGPEEMKPVGETVYIDGLASDYAANNPGGMNNTAAIISYADLRLGDAVTPILEAHQEASPSRFRGTRHGVGWDAHPDAPNSHTKPMQSQLLDSTFRDGVECLQNMGLIYEVYLYHTQLLELTDLARAFPDLTIIMNHHGGPLGVGPYDIMSEDMRSVWRHGISEVASCPNVVAKLGGIAMPRNGFGFHEWDAPPTSEKLAELTAPFYHHTIEAFGPDRCMFESNYPVEKYSCSYTVLWNSFKRISAQYSESEKATMFHDTAVRTYDIQ